MAEQTNTAPNLWALLIGIDQYKSPKIRPLKGCVNDIDQMRQFLVNQMSVPEAQIKMLRNAEATRANVIAAFQNFLVDNPAMQPGAQILFHYSGHGSQMPSRSLTEPDGLDETIVVHDARTQTGAEYIFDIPDKTIAALLEKLSAAKGDNITVFLDCCHSGSGTREVNVHETNVRNLDPDTLLPPADLDANIRRATHAERVTGMSGMSIRTQPNHVLIAGCRDMELSHEMTGRDEKQHGALTYFLLDYLCNRSGTNDVAYADLHEYVAAKVNAVFRNQMPVCEGQRNRKLFGGATIQRDPFITVSQVSGNIIMLNAGSLLPGLAVGAVLTLYPATVTTKADLARVAPIATADVTEISPVSATAKVTTTDSATPVVALCRAVIDKPAYAATRQKVSLRADPDATDADRQAIQSLEADLRARRSATLDVVAQGGDLRVIAKAGALRVCDADEADLIVPEDIASNNSNVADALEAIARWRALAQMTNRDPQSRVQGKLKLRLLHHVESSEPVPLSAIENTSDGITLTADADEYSLRNQYVIEIDNRSDVGVYPHVVILNPDFSIVHLYPEGSNQQSQLLAGRTLQCGIDNSGERYRAYLPPDWASSQDRLLLIATGDPSDLGVLNQGGLRVPAPTRGITSSLADMLDDLSRGTRMGGNSASRLKGVDWGTTLLTYRTARASQTVPLPLGQTEVLLDHGIKLTKPAAQVGAIKVEMQSEVAAGNRSVAGDADKTSLPPGLAALGEHFALVGPSSARGSGLTGLVFTLTLDASARDKSIGTEQPLTLDLSQIDDSAPDDLLPVVFDGQDYLLLPNLSQASGRVALGNLPTPKAALDGTATQRGFLNALKLFIFKKLGHYTPELGLKRVVNDGSDVKRVVPHPSDFKPGDKAVLFVHGFTSDTHWMSGGIAPRLASLGFNYDHILTFDYESFGTGVSDNGQTLANALRNMCGFNAGDGVHLDVFAHSMGCLVARSMIELHDGQAFVDRLVIAGPPNQGTALATAAATTAKIAEFLFDMLLNGTVPIVASVAAALLKLIDASAQGFADIQAEPLSPTTRQLSNLPQPAKVPYLVLAGVYDEAANDAQQARIARIAEKVFDQSLTAMFGEPNDLVIGQHSMEGVRQQPSDLITVKEVGCSHTHYFVCDETFSHLQTWLAKI